MDILRRTHFPYCLERQADDTWVMLNRHYKPIGFMTSEYLDYAAFPVGFRLRNVPRKTLEALACEGGFSDDTVYLYDDGCTPEPDTPHLDSYLQKLSLLLRLKVEAGG